MSVFEIFNTSLWLADGEFLLSASERVGMFDRRIFFNNIFLALKSAQTAIKEVSVKEKNQNSK